MNVKKYSCDKVDLGLVDACASFHITSNANCVSRSETIFMKALKRVEDKLDIACLDKGKNVVMNDYSKSKSRSSPTRKPITMFVHTCHHCGRVGHIGSHCFMLRSQDHVCEDSYSMNNQKRLFRFVKDVLLGLDVLDN